jgi:hypothetical protein
MTKIEARPTFVADGRTVQFVPCTGVPGFTHRVIVDRERVGFLANGFRPNAKAAVYYLSDEFAAKRK